MKNFCFLIAGSIIGFILAPILYYFTKWVISKLK